MATQIKFKDAELTAKYNPVKRIPNQDITKANNRPRIRLERCGDNSTPYTGL